MRKFLYILVGIVMVGGAVSAFGARQFGAERDAALDAGSVGHRVLERSMDGEPRSWFSDRGQHNAGRPWFDASRALDLLFALVGGLGIALTVSGMQMSARPRHQSASGKV